MSWYRLLDFESTYLLLVPKHLPFLAHKETIVKRYECLLYVKNIIQTGFSHLLPS